MSFIELIFRNVLTRKVRSALTAVAIAIAIMAVFALGVLTFSLRETAISILRTGRADFTVGQKGVSDVIYSSMDEQDVHQLSTYPEVESAVGVQSSARDMKRLRRIAGDRKRRAERPPDGRNDGPKRGMDMSPY